MNFFKQIAAFSIIALLVASCSKYKEIGDTDFYPDQKVYLPAAVDGVSSNGIYQINSVAVPGQKYRYVADVPNKKLVLPLSVYRAGLGNNGALSVNILANTDTITKFLAAGKFPAGTELLPADKYTIGSSVTISDGAETADFTLTVDLNFLLANPTKKYAIGVGVTANGKGLGAASTAVILIDPAFLLPTASFTTTVGTRTVNFSNTSLNAATYSWDYGDGTPVSTDKATAHTYAAAGTYTIKLTVSGALGDFNKAVYSSSVVIP